MNISSENWVRENVDHLDVENTIGSPPFRAYDLLFEHIKQREKTCNRMFYSYSAALLITFLGVFDFDAEISLFGVQLSNIGNSKEFVLLGLGFAFFMYSSTLNKNRFDRSVCIKKAKAAFGQEFDALYLLRWSGDFELNHIIVTASPAGMRLFGISRLFGLVFLIPILVLAFSIIILSLGGVGALIYDLYYNSNYTGFQFWLFFANILAVYIVSFTTLIWGKIPFRYEEDG